MTDIDIESEEGAQQKADQAQSNAESFAESEVESHRSTETHDTAQPPQSHDNEVHDRDFVDGGEAAAAAPVQSVNGQQGDVEIVSGVELQEASKAQTFSESEVTLTNTRTEVVGDAIVIAQEVDETITMEASGNDFGGDRKGLQFTIENPIKEFSYTLLDDTNGTLELIEDDTDEVLHVFEDDEIEEGADVTLEIDLSADTSYTLLAGGGSATQTENETESGENLFLEAVNTSAIPFFSSFGIVEQEYPEGSGAVEFDEPQFINSYGAFIARFVENGGSIEFEIQRFDDEEGEFVTEQGPTAGELFTIDASVGDRPRIKATLSRGEEGGDSPELEEVYQTHFL